MNTMVPGLAGGKMSSSDPNSKIDFLDSPAVVKSKIQKALCAPGEVEGNGVLAFVRNVIIPIGDLMRSQGRASERVWTTQEDAAFTVTPNPKFGGEPMHFKSADELEAAYAKGADSVHPGDLKAAVVASINALLAPIQKDFEENEEFKKAEALAYPPVVRPSLGHKPLRRWLIPYDAQVKPVVQKKVKKHAPKPDHLKTAEERAAEAGAAAPSNGLDETTKMKDALPTA